MSSSRIVSENGTGLGHVQWLLLSGRGQDLGELVGDVGGGKVEGGGEGRLLGRLVGAGLLTTATVTERDVTEDSALTTVVPLLGLKLKHNPHTDRSHSDL